jgi:aminoglycoside/choline kinase family phosphotransferase
MNDSSLRTSLTQMYKNWAGEQAHAFGLLPESGSYRKYYRLTSKNKSAIGVFNDDRKENVAFLSFSLHFKKEELNVPEIYAQDLNKNIYLQQDLGDETLFSFMTKYRKNTDFPDNVKKIYTKVVRSLPGFQIKAADSLDYSVCYPRAGFDKQSMMWDLNYFKYYFLKLAKIPFDEQKLEDDFIAFTSFLLESPRDFFLYRDFQSRNIMIKNDDVYFIDYQGGRKGALQYDIASLLYDAKADIPNNVREELLDAYLEVIQQYISIDRKRFLQHYYGYVLIRIMQALGAYGFRGYYEHKEHFLKSVPFAIQNLEYLLHTVKLPVAIPALTDAWSRLVRSSSLRTLTKKQLRLTVRINSFSYKRGIPMDDKGHGGGFVFDCRSLPNPGRFEKYQTYNGYDKPVIDFFKKEKKVKEFLSHVSALTGATIKNYQDRNFTDLYIAFGCTGGQHRSVYCANQLAQYITDTFKVDIDVYHREQEIVNHFSAQENKLK